MDVEMKAFAMNLWQFFLAYKLIALFALIFIEEAGLPLPLPGDILVMYMGYRLHAGDLSALWSLPLTSLAVAGGSSTLYMVALKVGHPLLVKYGRFLKLTPEKVAEAEKRIMKFGPWAIILGRLVPGLRTPTSLVSGLLTIPYPVFVSATSTAAIIWTIFYFALGYLFGEGYRAIGSLGLGHLQFIIAIVITPVFLYFGALVFSKNRRKRREKRGQKQAPT